MALKVVKHDFTDEEMATVSLVAQMVKDLPAMRETQVPSLGQKDPLEKGMAIHSSILAWRIPQTKPMAGYRPWGHTELDMTECLLHFPDILIEEGIKPFQTGKKKIGRRIRCLKPHHSDKKMQAI